MDRITSWVVSSLAVASVLALAGCGGDDGGCGNPPAISGDWSGTLVDSNCGNGSFAATFLQEHCQLNGLWSANFSVPVCDEQGTLRGSLDDNKIDATLSPSSGGCSFDVAAVVNNPNEIGGTYTPRGNFPTSGGGSGTRSGNAPVTPTPSTTGTPAATST